MTPRELDFQQWFQATFQHLLAARYSTFYQALLLAVARHAKVLVETGTTRQSGNWTGDGQSTMVLGAFAERFGARLTTCDIAAANIAACREITKPWSQSIEYVAQDSVEFLRAFAGPIDLLYLDSFDFDPQGDPNPAQDHALKEGQNALHALHKQSIILIDDCDIVHGGKGGKVIPFLSSEGWQVVGKSYQVLMAHSSANGTNSTVAPPQNLLEQARKHHEIGEFAQAALLLEQFIGEEPGHAAALCALGKALKRLGRLAEAQEALQKAVEAKHDFAEAHYQLGLVFGQQQKVQESLGCFFQALTFQPHFPEAHFNLGIGMAHLKKRPQAIFHYRQAIAQHPHFAEAHLHLAAALEDQELWDEAMAGYRRFLEMHPEHADARNRLGVVLAKQQRLGEAMTQFEKVAKLQPAWPSVHHNMAVALSEQNRLHDALRCFDEAIRRSPDHGEAHKGKSMAMLKLGMLPDAWKEYEWRLKCADNSVPPTDRPMWDGGPLEGKTILLRAEQGYGDSLQFIRYARLVKEAGARVLFDCPAALMRLFKNCSSIDEVVERGSPLPDFDVHAALMSAPYFLNTAVDTIPAQVPYLYADEGLTEQWRQELRASSSFNIGIVWQGNPREWNSFLRAADKRRSFTLSLFEPLARLPGVKLYSLQKGYGTEQLGQVRFPVTDLGSRVNDFMDTAAVMMNLDLVISADSAPAHLAGGLGIPVWVPIPLISCWRWFTDREDSPWYPTMRLFRQAEKGNWNGVFRRIASALRDELRKSRPQEAGLEPLLHPEEANGHADIATELALALKHFQSQRFAESEEVLRQLLSREPGQGDPWYQLGLAQQRQNKLTDAADSYRQLLDLQPEHVEGHTNLGIVLRQLGQREEGEAYLRRVLALRPEHAKGHNNLGVALAESGKKNEAMECWQEAVRLDPGYLEGHLNLGGAPAERMQIDEAAACYERGLEIKPDHAETYNRLGWMRVEQGRQEEAVVLLEHAIRLNPDCIDAYNNLGVALADLGRLKSALKSYRESLRRRPMDANVHNNMGTTLAALGRTKEALACFELALKIQPDYPEVHWHQALTYLQSGDMTRGWPKYEWRWKRKRSRPRPFQQPLWDGGSIEGKTILLWCEQGLGDCLQFIRYVPLVKERGARVIVECRADLTSLVASCPGMDQLVPERSELPPFDVQIPLMSLPGVVGTTLTTVPAKVPYLSADSERVAAWHKELNGTSDGAAKFKIGVAWQGNPKHRFDRHRSFPPDYFRALSRMKAVQLFSLQKGPQEQIDDYCRRLSIVELGSKLNDLSDTAAVMRNLDLVITCDSAPAHLAGALGVPVWLALSTMSEWRWMTRREDSPWYPTMRLFRQKRLGDWDELFARMTAELTGLLPR